MALSLVTAVAMSTVAAVAPMTATETLMTSFVNSLTAMGAYMRPTF